MSLDMKENKVFLTSWLFSFDMWQKCHACCLFCGENNCFLTDPLSCSVRARMENPSSPLPLADSDNLCTWTAPEHWGQHGRVCWGKIPFLPPAVSSCLLAVQGPVLLPFECTIPVAAVINDPCHCGRQEQWKRLLLYNPLLPLLRGMSQLSCQCVGSVQAHLTWSKARQLHESFLHRRNHVHTYSRICCSIVSAWWGL